MTVFGGTLELPVRAAAGRGCAAAVAAGAGDAPRPSRPPSSSGASCGSTGSDSNWAPRAASMSHIDEDDPLSAVVEMRQTQTISRDAWRTRIETRDANCRARRMRFAAGWHAGVRRRRRGLPPGLGFSGAARPGLSLGQTTGTDHPACALIRPVGLVPSPTVLSVDEMGRIAPPIFTSVGRDGDERRRRRVRHPVAAERQAAQAACAGPGERCRPMSAPRWRSRPTRR